MTSVTQSQELQSVVALVKTLTNVQLKDILRREGLAVSGVKASLQLRIIDFLERLSQAGQFERYDSLRKFIYATANRSMPSPSHSQVFSGEQHRTSSISQSTPVQQRPSPLGISMSPHGVGSAREQTRDSVELRVVLSPSVASRMQADPNIRVMVYCAADSGLTQYTKSDIAFPHQVELKANLDEVKANLRGLKNKPGTTRPADVTNYIRKRPGYPNHIVMTYALTQKRFYVLANLVQRHPVETLVAELKMRKTIPKEQVIREMRSRADDSDIVATSSVMSLKCPLSTLRIQVPCRSLICTHNRCFDASSFLQLQEQAPTWSCPICSKATSFESLHVDQYVDDILHSTTSDVEQVVIEPDGRWSAPKGDDATGADGFNPASDEDELIEVREPGVTPIKQEATSAQSYSLLCTPTQSREPSTASAAHQSTNKRSVAQVIDLTASDDEDDDSPVRPAKRPALNTFDRFLPGQETRNLNSTGFSNGAALAFASQTSSESPAQTGGYDAMSFETTSSSLNISSDPHARLVSTSCLDFLLIELVPMAERLAKELSDNDRILEDEEVRETTFFRLESLGYRVGQGLVERFARDRPRFSDNLDVIKFLCKDLWSILFRKQIDNLKTNHRGVYVLTDSSFRPFARMSMSVRGDAVTVAQAYLWFPCGIIRGALSNLGINTTVQAETTELPGATFQIKTVQSKP
ncbi:transport protein particle component-domain-containing protein [Aspergillus candidus]|uniref:Transport protein particle component-domain-containing protein n=1 Tax=Aspergillus candidus TaxID=41067 RepID=A0A2I2F1I8_ASPCN|nr:transport protein particle component-domain-containing protein [Aspergillus candidus]PLB34495.1 transport protein particle component-domain-containing protein [Aspergillus candidus]